MAWVVFRLRLKLNGAVFSCFLIFDPRQLPNLPMDPAAYPLMLPNNVRAQVVDNGEWALYKACVVPDNGDFDIHQWWDSMKDRLPTMYPYAIQTLCIPHTSCDVERSFSMWKNVRSEKQYNMQHVLTKRMSHLDLTASWMAHSSRILKENDVHGVALCMQSSGRLVNVVIHHNPTILPPFPHLRF